MRFDVCFSKEYMNKWDAEQIKLSLPEIELKECPSCGISNNNKEDACWYCNSDLPTDK